MSENWKGIRNDVKGQFVWNCKNIAMFEERAKCLRQSVLARISKIFPN